MNNAYTFLFFDQHYYKNSASNGSYTDCFGNQVVYSGQANQANQASHVNQAIHTIQVKQAN